MFGGAGDPFGGNPFQFMRRQMQEMDAMMNDMMGGDPFARSFFGGMHHPTQQMLMDSAAMNHPHRSTPHARTNGSHHQVQHPMENMMLNPFGMGGGIFGGFGSLMQNMEYAAHNAMHDPHSTVFTQSTMISFDGEGGQPRVVSNSTRKAGDVKETRRQVQHGPEIEELVVGHSIGDRAHVIEKKRDKDGRVRKQQRFINLDQEEAEDFNEEFKSRANHNLSSSGIASIIGGGGGSSQQRAITDSEGRHGHSHSHAGSSHPPRGRSSRYQEGTSGSNGRSGGPIVTVPDDDEDDDVVMVEERRGHRNGGPTIREVTDEEADEERSKRRKGGLFGRFG